MLNWIWLGLILSSVVIAAFTGKMADVTQASIDSAKTSVDLAIGLVGIMAFWLGIMKVAQDGGLLKTFARFTKPVMGRLFPEVPIDHPGMSMMIMNMAANMLGLANAATPFGIKAMIELDKLNKYKGVATNAMALFLAINTSNVALLPLGTIGLRAAAGSQDAAGIIFTTLVATTASTLVAIIATNILVRLPRFRVTEGIAGTAETKDIELPTLPEGTNTIKIATWLKAIVVTSTLVALSTGLTLTIARSPEPFFVTMKDILSYWLLPVVMVFLLLYSFAKGVKVYESLVEGAKEGFSVAIRIIPFLVAIIVAVSMFRASGAMEFLVTILSPLTNLIGMPAEALPMALLRPLSGSGAMAVMTEIMTTHGPDSLIGYIVSTMQGSTETTFYVLAVYCGAVGVKNLRHTLPACLLADVAGVMASVWICNFFFR